MISCGLASGNKSFSQGTADAIMCIQTLVVPQGSRQRIIICGNIRDQLYLLLNPHINSEAGTIIIANF